LASCKNAHFPEDVKFDPITAEILRAEKTFLKVLKKHQKELDSMRKRHLKERTLIQKSQCGAIEKLVKTKGK